MVSNRSHWFSSPYYSCCCCRHNLLFIHLFIPPAQEYYRFNFLGGSDGNESACNARDLGLIPGSGRSPGEGKGYPLKHSCLKNHMDGGNWRATVYGVAKSQTRLSDFNRSCTKNFIYITLFCSHKNNLKWVPLLPLSCK